MFGRRRPVGMFFRWPRARGHSPASYGIVSPRPMVNDPDVVISQSRAVGNRHSPCQDRKRKMLCIQGEVG